MSESECSSKTHVLTLCQDENATALGAGPYIMGADDTVVCGFFSMVWVDLFVDTLCLVEVVVVVAFSVNRSCSFTDMKPSLGTSHVDSEELAELT